METVDTFLLRVLPCVYLPAIHPHRSVPTNQTHGDTVYIDSRYGVSSSPTIVIRLRPLIARLLIFIGVFSCPLVTHLSSSARRRDRELSRCVKVPDEDIRRSIARISSYS